MNSNHKSVSNEQNQHNDHTWPPNPPNISSPPALFFLSSASTLAFSESWKWINVSRVYSYFLWNGKWNVVTIFFIKYKSRINIHKWNKQMILFRHLFQPHLWHLWNRFTVFCFQLFLNFLQLCDIFPNSVDFSLLVFAQSNQFAIEFILYLIYLHHYNKIYIDWFT